MFLNLGAGRLCFEEVANGGARVSEKHANFLITGEGSKTCWLASIGLWKVWLVATSRRIIPYYSHHMPCPNP